MTGWQARKRYKQQYATDVASSIPPRLGSEHDLAGVAGGHSLEGVVEIFQRKVVGHHRREVHSAASDQAAALVPGLPHPAAADAHDMGGFEHDMVVPVEGESPGR